MLSRTLVPVLSVPPEDDVLLAKCVVLVAIALPWIPVILGEPTDAVQLEALEVELRMHTTHRTTLSAVHVDDIRTPKALAFRHLVD